MKDRERTIHAVREVLQRHASPRLHMLVLVAVTAACGLLSSALLLHAGVTRMAVRYPLAVGLAYLAFLGLVAMWLRRFQLRARDSRGSEDGGVVFDIVELPVDAMWSDAPTSDSGGGPGFGGGGSSRSWSEATANTVTTHSPAPSSTADLETSVGGGWGVDLDEGALWLIPVAVIGLLALGVLIYVVYIAPALFAELLLDAGLAAGLYRLLTRVERRSWLTTAIRNTVVPAALVAALLAVSGLIMQAVYPDTVSVGGVVHHVLKSSRQRPSDRAR